MLAESINNHHFTDEDTGAHKGKQMTELGFTPGPSDFLFNH